MGSNLYSPNSSALSRLQAQKEPHRLLRQGTKTTLVLFSFVELLLVSLRLICSCKEILCMTTYILQNVECLKRCVMNKRVNPKTRLGIAAASNQVTRHKVYAVHLAVYIFQKNIISISDITCIDRQCQRKEFRNSDTRARSEIKFIFASLGVSSNDMLTMPCIQYALTSLFHCLIPAITLPFGSKYGVKEYQSILIREAKREANAYIEPDGVVGDDLCVPLRILGRRDFAWCTSSSSSCIFIATIQSSPSIWRATWSFVLPSSRENPVMVASASCTISCKVKRTDHHLLNTASWPFLANAS